VLNLTLEKKALLSESHVGPVTSGSERVILVPKVVEALPNESIAWIRKLKGTLLGMSLKVMDVVPEAAKFVKLMASALFEKLVGAQ
jgi:hypothetical protein